MLNILIIASMFAITAPYLLGPAKAHEWYPADCCYGGDCAPVDNVTRIIPAGSGEQRLVLTSKHGTAVLPPDFPIRESKDYRMHVCMRPSLYGGMGVTCVFMPPSMY
jgi:hypothetical protein